MQTFDQALDAQRNGRFKEAEDLYRKIISNDPSNFDALHMLAIVCFENGKVSEADNFFRTALAIDPRYPPIFRHYGQFLARQKRYHDSLEQFDKALKLFDKFAPVYCDRGISLMELGRLDESLSSHNMAANLAPDIPIVFYNRANTLFRQKSFQSALRDYDRAIALHQKYSDAHCGRGNILYELKRYDEASAAYDRALALKPDLENAWLGRGNVYYVLKRYDEASEAYDRAMALKPDLENAWLGRGNVCYDLKRYDEASAAYDKALALKPDLETAWLGRGNVCYDLKRYDEASAAYDKALALKPDLETARLGRGNVYCGLKRYDEAFAAYDRALALKPDLENAWLGRGNVYYGLKRYDEASKAYDRALALKPDLENAWLGRGNVYYDLKRYDEASVAYDRALALRPDLETAWLGRGNVHCDLKRYDEASAAYDRALALKPDLENAWLGRGNVYYHLKRYDEASAAYDKALALKPDLLGTEGMRLRTKLLMCDWNNFHVDFEHLISSVKNKRTNTSPFDLLATSSSPEDQLQCAKLWIEEQHPLSQKPFWRGERHKHPKIRLAYLSADFRQHPVSALLAGVIECHDRSRFDTTAISIGPDDGSEVRQRLKRSFDHFVDIAPYSDQQAAAMIKEAEIDILVDLMGFTADARTTIFSWRPAPIQVNFLGYPGTMAADYMDYIVADPIVIPAPHQKYYTEKIAYLPNTFMPSDSKRPVSGAVPDRAQYGLPETGTVFCCFNNTGKLNPDLFDCWIRLLNRVEGSVLWLSAAQSAAAANLKKEASVRGANPDRLVFAKRLPSLADHLARHRVADLFLDSLPYNAHTTASDALWAGLPVLTQIGETFAGRVAASLLNAIGLPELVTQTRQEYENAAIDLATNPVKLALLKDKVTQNRLTTPIFNTELFTRHIESAYMAMFERYQAGLQPDHISVATLNSSR